MDWNGNAMQYDENMNARLCFLDVCVCVCDARFYMVPMYVWTA